MKVESLPYPGRAVCSGRGQTENLDVLMLGDVQIGEWVLAWNGMGTKKITEERARQVDAALDALEAAMNGQTPDVEDAFADIVANTGKLPPHQIQFSMQARMALSVTSYSRFALSMSAAAAAILPPRSASVMGFSVPHSWVNDRL